VTVGLQHLVRRQNATLEPEAAAEVRNRRVPGDGKVLTSTAIGLARQIAGNRAHPCS